MRTRIAHQQALVQQADATQRLKAHWTAYTLAIQEQLEQHLDLFGLNSAQSCTNILGQYSVTLLARITGDDNEKKEK